MKRRQERLIVLTMLAILAIALLSRIVPNHSEIHVTGSNGKYHLISTGTGPQELTVELGDGAYAKTRVR